MTERGGDLPHPVKHPRPDISVKTAAADNKVPHRQIHKITVCMERRSGSKTACKHNKEQFASFLLFRHTNKDICERASLRCESVIELVSYTGLAYSSRASDSSCLYLMPSIKSALSRNNRPGNPTLMAVITNVENCSVC